MSISEHRKCIAKRDKKTIRQMDTLDTIVFKECWKQKCEEHVKNDKLTPGCWWQQRAVSRRRNKIYKRQK
jgi:hypothetical protein